MTIKGINLDSTSTLSERHKYSKEVDICFWFIHHTYYDGLSWSPLFRNLQSFVTSTIKVINVNNECANFSLSRKSLVNRAEQKNRVHGSGPEPGPGGSEPRTGNIGSGTDFNYWT